MNPLRILVIGAGVGGISIARGLLRDGHDVTVFEQRADVTAGGGAVTIWSNGATVLKQLGVDMTGAGQLLSTVRVVSSTGRRLANFDVDALVNRLGAPVRMVPRRVLLERLLDGFPADRIQCESRVVGVVNHARRSAGRVRRRERRRRGPLDRCRWSALGGSRCRRRATCRANRLVQLAGTGHPSRRRRQARRAHHRRRARKRWPVARWRIRSAVVVRHAVVERLRQAAAADRDDPVQLHRMDRFDRSIGRDVDRRRLGPFAVPAFSACDSPRTRSRTAYVARRRRTHDAAHARPGNQSGATRHHGVVPGALGAREPQRPQQSRPVECVALVREHQTSQGQGGVVDGVAAGVPQRAHAQTGGTDLGPVHDVGADHLAAYDKPPQNVC